MLFERQIESWSDMRRLVAPFMVASSTQQVTQTMSADAGAQLEEWPGLCALITRLAERLRKERFDRGRGAKPYDLLLPCYFSDIARVLRALRPVLAPGARCAWLVGDSSPYGVYIDTPTLLCQLASDLGFEILEDRVLRERGSRWRNGQRPARRLTERLVLFRRPQWGEQQMLPGFHHY